MVYESLIELIGEVPVGLEDFVYIFSGVTVLWLLLSCFTFLGSLFKRIMQL